MSAILEDAAHQCLLSDDHPTLFDALPSFEDDLLADCPGAPPLLPPAEAVDGATGSSLPATPAERPCTFCPISLPLPASSCPTRATLVLDLDGTLIASEELNAANSTFLRDPCTSRSPDYEAIGRRVWLRPGVREFLTAVRPHFEIVLFTAATQNWAAAAIEQLDPSAYLFDVMLHRDHTTSDLMWDYVKDLSRLGRDLSRVVIVDDNPLMFMYQPDNALHVQAYEAAAAGGPDNVLDRVAELLVGQVAPATDVRLVLGPMASAKTCVLSTIAVAATAAAVGGAEAAPQAGEAAAEAAVAAAVTAAGAAGGAAPMDVASDVPSFASGTQRHACGRPVAFAPREVGSGWSGKTYAGAMCMAGEEGEDCGALFGFAGSDGALEMGEGEEGQDDGLLQADEGEQEGEDAGGSAAAGLSGGRCVADEGLSDGEGDEEEGGGSDSEAEVEVFDEHGAAARLGGGRCWGRRGRAARSRGPVDAMDADAAEGEGEEGDGTCSGPDSDDLDALMDETISISGYDSDIGGGLDDEGAAAAEEDEQEAALAEGEAALAGPYATESCAGADAGCLCGCGPGACAYGAGAYDAAGGDAPRCGGERVFAAASADSCDGTGLHVAFAAPAGAMAPPLSAAAGVPEAHAGCAAPGAHAAQCVAVVEGPAAACDLACPAAQQQPQPGLPGMVFLTDLNPALAPPQPLAHPISGAAAPAATEGAADADVAHAEGAPPCKRARVELEEAGGPPATGCEGPRVGEVVTEGGCEDGGGDSAQLAGVRPGNSGGGA
ncbi:CTD small phosphatase-like protein 2, partial [Tetrabaena socialis]